MMEGLSYIAGTEVPAVLVNVMRGGPGLGNIAPSQGDYNQSVHGGGHGDYPRIVLAPASVQEAIDLTVLSFDLAERYRMIVMLILDGCVGQMMEPAEMPAMQSSRRRDFEWATNGTTGRERRTLTSIYLDPLAEEQTNLRLMNRWKEVQRNEVRFKEYFLEDAEIVIVGFGTAGRVSLSAVREARAHGIKVGLLRPVTVSPFPFDVLSRFADRAHAFLVVEMNAGQMLGDVQLAARGRIPVEFYGRIGGVVPLPDEILREIRRVADGGLTLELDPRDAWLTRMSSRPGDCVPVAHGALR
jgi:2-oxoglutarate ferredoxin oxidoreductase subunit alpha